MQGAVRDVGGVTDYHTQLIEFAVRLLLDASSPSNCLASNPELLALTQSEQGQNLVRGLQHVVEDTQRTVDGMAPAGTEDFEVGKKVAVTPGKVVFRNELIELIQYTPATKTAYAEPILIVPAWIMKYYILDLSARNSMVKYLVDQGHTVFMMSWKNPDESDRDIGMDDYLDKGFHAALDAVSAIVPGEKIHAVGYCIGGTLLSIGAAALARERDERLASITMFAAQTDFSEPGELAFFINPSQLAMLEATMHKKGVLESRQMGGAFMLLRAQDMLWQPIINNYLKGQRDPMIDLMAWNADGTRMPWRMHSEYLYRLYLDNELATNRFPVDGKLIRLSDIRVPMFVVGTEADHVAPWKSVYKVDNLVRSDDFSFLLTSGGHNAGIICGPVHPKRHYRIKTRRLADPHLAPEDWMEAATKHDGSWWPAWQRWLAAHSGAKGKPPAIGAPRKGYPWSRTRRGSTCGSGNRVAGAREGGLRTAFGPLQTFVLERSRIAPAGAIGCPPPRMSATLGCAQGSPFISLRRAPAVPGLEQSSPLLRPNSPHASDQDGGALCAAKSRRRVGRSPTRGTFAEQSALPS